MIDRMSRCFLGLILLLTAAVSCGNADSEGGKPSGAGDSIREVTDSDHFRRILSENGDRLLVFDFYADWCGPCKRLKPILESLAQKNGDRASFFKVDVDRNRDLAASVGLRGIPWVLFVKNGKQVHSLMGLHPKAAYARAVEQHAGVTPDTRTADTPDGEIVDGVRVIRRSPAETMDDIFVYRGETVRLIVEDIRFPYGIHVPEYGISKEVSGGQDLEVTFKAKNIGVYPIFCNGDCPSGDGANIGRIVVIQFESTGEARYAELSAEQAKGFIDRAHPLILDVRTPAEYYSGHLENAKLIPLQQLEARIGEIRSHRDRDVLLYCRSGNRSTVAAEILMRDGFKNLHNLRYGILEWIQKGYKVFK